MLAKKEKILQTKESHLHYIIMKKYFKISGGKTSVGDSASLESRTSKVF